VTGKSVPPAGGARKAAMKGEKVPVSGRKEKGGIVLGQQTKGNT